MSKVRVLTKSHKFAHTVVQALWQQAACGRPKSLLVTCEERANSGPTPQLTLQVTLALRAFEPGHPRAALLRQERLLVG